MKSLADLKKLKEEASKKVNMRNSKDGYRVAVGMATCGIAAGARPVLNKFVELVGEKGLDDVVVTQVGCVGQCDMEPMLDVIDTEGTKTTYINVKEEDVITIIESHLVNGEIVEALIKK
jgi:NADP-reducing hydrogenase subunit HndB